MNEAGFDALDEGTVSGSLFDGFYGTGEDVATWDWFLGQEKLSNNTQSAALVAYVLPGFKTNNGTGLLGTSFAGYPNLKTIDATTRYGRLTNIGVKYIVNINLTIDGVPMTDYVVPAVGG